MHPLLPLRIEHVTVLHKEGIRSLDHAKAIIDQAVKLRRSNKLYPELSQKAGLCQRVIVNTDTFKVMMRWCINKEAEVKRPIVAKKKKK